MPSEVRTVVSLALLYAFRMLGLFMVLPVLMLYGDEYIGATPALLGLALGVYGLTQALFQIPLGLMSDIIGRKTIILFGLAVFAVGSVVAANASTIEGLILGRALQGAGAIASAIMAMVADLTAEQNRTKAMAAIGASIGLSFSVAMVLGPIIAASWGVSGLFILSAILSGIGALIVIFIVPTPPQTSSHRDTGAIPKLMLETLKNAELLRLNWGIFCLHAVLMAAFVVVPTQLESVVGLAKNEHWKIYFPVLFFAFVCMLPFIIIAEKKRRMKQVFVASILLLSVTLLLLAISTGNGIFSLSLLTLVLFLFLFFVAFNLLEATLPSLVSKISPAGGKGTAMGLYSTSQFLGAFTGGAAGGTLFQLYGPSAVLAFSAALASAWLLVALFMRAPKYLASLCLPVAETFDKVDQVMGIAGVEEALYAEEESLLYLKVDRQRLDQQGLEQLTSS